MTLKFRFRLITSYINFYVTYLHVNLTIGHQRTSPWPLTSVAAPDRRPLLWPNTSTASLGSTSVRIRSARRASLSTVMRSSGRPSNSGGVQLDIVGFLVRTMIYHWTVSLFLRCRVGSYMHLKEQDSASVDLVTCCQAIHWFDDIPAFYAEVCCTHLHLPFEL